MFLCEVGTSTERGPEVHGPPVAPLGRLESRFVNHLNYENLGFSQIVTSGVAGMILDLVFVSIKTGTRLQRQLGCFVVNHSKSSMIACCTP
jgi:hypothetical protein